jgi:hypothetical protein
MIFQPDPNLIRWRIHLKTPPINAFACLVTDASYAWEQGFADN